LQRVQNALANMWRLPGLLVQLIFMKIYTGHLLDKYKCKDCACLHEKHFTLPI